MSEHAYNMRFLHHSTVDFLGWIILGCGDCPLPCRMFISVSGFYLLHVSSTYPSGCDNQKMSPTLPSVPWGPTSPPAENHCCNHSSRGMDPGSIWELNPLEPVEAPGRHCQRPRKPWQRTMPCAADGNDAGSLSEAGDEKIRRGTGAQERKPLGGGVGLEVSCVSLGKFLDLSEMQSSRPKSEITTCRAEV